MKPQQIITDGSAVDMLYAGRPGARPEDWQHFVRLGLVDDLLPVVSDPTVGISPVSRMQSIGKTPSVLGGDGLIVGMARWTQRQSTSVDVSRWQADGRLGICVQTRHVRAIDVDIDDPEMARDIAVEIEAFALRRLPRRDRENSAKFLLVFRLEGEHRKRIIRTAHGIIEFLADGQQFVAIGTHPSGARYRWQAGEEGATPDGLPLAIPELDVAEFDALWAHLVARFGIEGSTTARTPRPPSGAEDRDPTADDVVRFIEDRGMVLGTGRDGERYVTCPWEHEHTSDSGVTQSVWFPAGSGGYEQGHYKCLHAHCEHRGRGEFLAEIGYGLEDFIDLEAAAAPYRQQITDLVTSAALSEDELGTLRQVRDLLPSADMPPGDVEAIVGRVTANTNLKADEVWNILGLAADPVERPARDLPPFKRNQRGEVLATIENIVFALRRPDVCGMRIGFDMFRDELMRARPGTNEWEPFRDSSYTAIRLRLEGRNAGIGFAPISKENLRDAVQAVAEENAFDSAQMWLASLKWDGTPRVTSFAARYLKTADTPYTRAVSQYLWTGLAGRVEDPGCKADMVPILVGAQGLRKSTAVSSIAPATEFFTEISLGTLSDADQARKMRGVLVAELPELRGLKTRDLESIKAFITRRHEDWTPKFKEFNTKFPRRLLLVGTTNEVEFLDDATGNRRWLPLSVGMVDIEAIERDRLQMWAEARELFKQNGVMYREAETLATEVHDAHRVRSEWEEAVLSWLESPWVDHTPAGFENLDSTHAGRLNKDREWVTSRTVLMCALRFEDRHITRKVEMDIAKVLGAIGYRPVKPFVGGKQIRAWAKANG